MEIRVIERNEMNKALDLVLITFMEFEAPDFSQEGIDTFKSSVFENEQFLKNAVFYGAFEGNDICGVAATRKHGSHLALLFVDGRRHRQGIGKKLFEHVLESCNADELTVNSSPYAVEVYHRMGFTDTAPEQILDGIRYTPMIYSKIKTNKK